jgi:hypothetical protein
MSRTTPHAKLFLKIWPSLYESSAHTGSSRCNNNNAERIIVSDFDTVNWAVMLMRSAITPARALWVKHYI